MITHKHTNIQSGAPAADPVHKPDRGPSMNSASGYRIYPLDPRPEDIDIQAVAHHLANNNRWNGATQHKTFRSRISFSVAEHSVLVSRFMVEHLKRPDLELEALLHDAPEYLFGDIIRPIKHHPEVHAVIEPIEDRAEKVFAERYGLIYPLPPEIKIADKAVCTAEFRQIVPHSPDDPSDMLHPDTLCAPYEIEMLTAYQAKEQFLHYFEDAVVRRNRMIAKAANW